MSQATGPASYPAPPAFSYAWARDDIECRLGFRGGRFTSVHSFLWLVVAGVLTVASYGAMSLAPGHWLVQMFTERGPCQYATVLFTFWALLILLAKVFKTRSQRRALAFTDLMPEAHDFVLSPGTVGRVLERLRSQCDDPTAYILFNRIDLALRNLKNLGRIGDVDDILRAQAENDENLMESSYSLVRGLIWAVPVLGFIGTVQGLSSAIGGFASVLEKARQMEELKPALFKVTGGLSTAFETTLVALVAVLGVHLLLTMIRRSEESLLDACSDYCQRHVVSRLKLTAFESVE